MHGKRIECPTLVLWSEKGFTTSFGDPLTIWKKCSDDVQGLSLRCGHFLMEEAPDEVFTEMLKFLQNHVMTNSTQGWVPPAHKGFAMFRRG